MKKKKKRTNEELFKHLLSAQMLIGALINELDKKKIINGHDVISDWETHFAKMKKELQL